MIVTSLIFPSMDQLDFTGPFEVFSSVPDTQVLTVWKDLEPVRDMHGLALTPDHTFLDAPESDVLLVPGGFGQEDLMEDEAVLDFLRMHAAQARIVFSVCTGALLLGAAGILRGKRATTNWAAREALAELQVEVQDARVVVHGNLVTAAGVTAGIDGALTVVKMLCGDAAAQRVQLLLEYAPAPPFDSGHPTTAPAEVAEAVREERRAMTEQRIATARRVAEKWRT